ncbi:hypothetical protein BCF33_1095 [Hasllibacter halocynthiae]|uniref:Amine oxidase domain-containing protein n=1 Tax=Hasllibacter halocynthiae TaxID=595589 RepID=A0A2T0X989_9RHOB|nr:hypothetical protein BCF33_1095 [Hasllibacter halocynthiae]
MRVDVAILGAGLAGLACGRRLAEAGLSVRLVDKGRRPGGRAAVRRPRAGGVAVNHGLPALTPEARALLPPLPEELEDAVDVLAAPLEATLGTPVAGVEAGGRLRWDGGGMEAGRVVSTLPRPQARALLGPGVPEAPMAPRWTLIARGTDLAPEALPRGWILGHAPPGAVAVHMAEEESRAALEEEKPVMAARMAARLGLPDDAEVAAHRWRHAHPAGGFGAPFAEAGGVLVGGDWCLGTGIADGAALAIRSGLAMADAVLGR